MGYEHGSVFIYKRKLWFFYGYSTDIEMRQTLKLIDVDGNKVKPLESECHYLISVSDIDWEAFEAPIDDEELDD
jgi:hypothetical protein